MKNAFRWTIPICVVSTFAFVGCSPSSTKPQSATATQDGATTPDARAATRDGPDSGLDEPHVRNVVHSHLEGLLSRPDFRVIDWEGEKMERFTPDNYWAVTGRVSFVNVFVEEATHEYAVLLLHPDELLQISIDGERIWSKPFENVSHAAQATTSGEKWDTAQGLFNTRFEDSVRASKAADAEIDPSDTAFGRIWTDRTGRYVVRAKLVDHRSPGMISLEKGNGDVINLSDSELSSDDRKWLKERGKTGPVRKE